jgi:hypothetical protein
VKPVLFLVLCAIIFTVIIHLFHITLNLYGLREDSFKDNENSKAIIAWSNSNLGYSQLILGVFISLWIKLIFRKQKYNFYEIVVLLSYVLGQALLILLLFLLVGKIFHFGIIAAIGAIFYMIYIVWGIGQFFGEKKIFNYLGSALAYILGVLTYLFILKSVTYLVTFL